MIEGGVRAPGSERSVDGDNERAELQAQVERLRWQLDDLTEYLPVALVELNLQSSAITLMNRVARIIFGYNRDDDLQEISVRDLFTPAELSRMTRLTMGLVMPSIESGRPYERTGGQEIIETVLRRKDGSEFPAEIQGSFVLNRLKQPRRLRLVCRDISERRALEAQREQLVVELQEALASVKTLRGLLPICAWCRKVRDDQGYWDGLEDYVRAHSETTFSHGICPSCAEALYPPAQAV